MGEIYGNCVCAINRQNYAPWQFGPPSLNSSPVCVLCSYYPCLQGGSRGVLSRGVGGGAAGENR
jgi:hypothetical protein